MKYLIFIQFFLLILGCQKKETAYSPVFSDQKSEKSKTYILAIHPLHNPERLQEMYGPIIQILNRESKDVQFVLESSKDYADYNNKIKEKRIHFLLPNPYQTIIAKEYGYHVFGKMGDDENFRGLVLIRKDSKIKKVTDLKGKKISFPAPTALAAAMMPKVYMEEHGLKLSKNEAEMKYVGSQESSILAVYHNEVDAGVTWPMVWNSFSSEKPEIKEKLKVFILTEKLINNSLMYKEDVPKEIIEKVKNTFINLHLNAEGKSILEKNKLSKFEASSDNDYVKVHDFLEKYKKIFGELP